MNVKLAAALLLSSLVAISQADKIDDFVKAEMAKNRIPGIVLGIVDHGKLSTRTYGFADLELNVKTTKDNIYEIGSITKQFTAFAAMMLVEQGKLSLDDPVSKYIPEAPESWKDITIRHLVYQTSGLQDYAFVPGIGLVDEFDRAKWMTEMTKLPLDFQPGIAWSYSNSNYALMGWVIEKASGVSYPEFVTTNVLKPLGMDHTSFDDTYAVVKNRAHGYYNIDPKTQIRVKPGSMTIASDGSLMTTIEDMAKWDAALSARKLLKVSSYDQIWAQGVLKNGRHRFYGMGWNLTPPDSKEYVGHGGNSVGYSAGFVRYPKDGISVIILGNVYAFNGEGTAKAIAEIYRPNLRPTIPSSTTDPDPARTAKVQNAMATFGKGEANDRVLAEEVIAPMKTARAGMSQGSVPLRNIKKLDFSSATPAGSDTWLTYRMMSGEKVYTAYVLWTSDDKLAQLMLRPDPVVK